MIHLDIYDIDIIYDRFKGSSTRELMGCVLGLSCRLRAPRSFPSPSWAPNVSGPGVAALIYSAVLAIGIAYAAWGYLLPRHPSAVVAPFGLLTRVHWRRGAMTSR